MLQMVAFMALSQKLPNYWNYVYIIFIWLSRQFLGTFPKLPLQFIMSYSSQALLYQFSMFLSSQFHGTSSTTSKLLELIYHIHASFMSLSCKIMALSCQFHVTFSKGTKDVGFMALSLRLQKMLDSWHFHGRFTSDSWHFPEDFKLYVFKNHIHITFMADSWRFHGTFMSGPWHFP